LRFANLADVPRDTALRIADEVGDDVGVEQTSQVDGIEGQFWDRRKVLVERRQGCQQHQEGFWRGGFNDQPLAFLVHDEEHTSKRAFRRPKSMLIALRRCSQRFASTQSATPGWTCSLQPVPLARRLPSWPRYPPASRCILTGDCLWVRNRWRSRRAGQNGACVLWPGVFSLSSQEQMSEKKARPKDARQSNQRQGRQREAA
jgi:hypothetical protein